MLDSVAEELFKRQIKFTNGRYQLRVPGQESERMNWFSSYYWAVMQKKMVEQFGNEYYVNDYHVGKLTGHIFGEKISKIVKTKSIVAPMISLIVKQFGYGKIEPIKTNYKENWLTFEFYDPPVGREISKFYGMQKFPVDFTIAGLVAGSAEQLIKRKFITMETTCIAKGDSKCTIETLSPENFEKKINTIQNREHKDVLEKILDLEKNTDFAKEVNKMFSKRDKKALLNEKKYLTSEGIH